MTNNHRPNCLQADAALQYTILLFKTYLRNFWYDQKGMNIHHHNSGPKLCNECALDWLTQFINIHYIIIYIMMRTLRFGCVLFLSSRAGHKVQKCSTMYFSITKYTNVVNNDLVCVFWEHEQHFVSVEFVCV